MILVQVAPSLLFGIAANTDNLTVGVAYGMKRRWIRWPQNLLIAAFTTLVTLGAMAAGWQIRKTSPSGSPDALGGILLLAFAGWNFYRDRSGAFSRPSICVTGFASRMSPGMGETLFLAGTLVDQQLRSCRRRRYWRCALRLCGVSHFLLQRGNACAWPGGGQQQHPNEVGAAVVALSNEWQCGSRLRRCSHDDRSLKGRLTPGGVRASGR